MKQFKIIRVKYKNIMSVGQKPIEIFMDKHHKTLVTGKNGAGKSTFLEALTFGIFGKPFREVKKGQLINSTNKKDLLVEVDMQFNGHLFEIRRGQKPTIFEIKKDGALIDENASAKDFQEYFEQLIGMSYNSFKQIVVLGTAGYTPFMGLNAPARRKLVEDLLEVTVLADMDKLNKTIIRDLTQQQSLVDMRIQHLTTEIQTHLDYTERQKQLSGDNLTRLQNMYDEQIKIVNNNKDKIADIADKITKIILPDDNTQKLNELLSESNKMMHRSNGYAKVLTLYKSGGACPTCFQQLSNPDLTGKIESHKHDVDTQAQKLTESHQELSKAQAQYNQLSEQIRALQREQEQYRASAIQAVAQAKKIKGAIDQAQQEVVDNSEKITELQNKKNDEIEKKSSLVMEKFRRSCITEMLKDSGIKGAIVHKYIPVFNKCINEYLKIMGADYVFTLDQEFSETIKSRGREDFSYASFSQGEKARIDIALLFTWRKIASMVTGVNISTLILDEVADGATDLEGVKAIQTILDSITDLNCFIISHRDHNPEDYGQHLQMKKVGRFTVME